MKVLGVTGGIGTGKSTVVSKFKELGVPTYVADDHAKRLMVEDSALVGDIIELAGEEAYIKNDGYRVLNRKYLADIAFQPTKSSKVGAKADFLQQLNALVHPVVKRDFEKWKAEVHAEYVVYEAAILLESGGQDRADYILLVLLEKEERIRRVMKRDKVVRQKVIERMTHQFSPYKSMESADILLINNNLSNTYQQINQIHEFLLKT